MNALQKNLGRTDQMLGAMADMLSSLALPSQQWLAEHGEQETGEPRNPVSSSEDRVQRSKQLSAPAVDWSLPQGATESYTVAEEESYSVAGSDGSISTSVASIQPQPSSSSAPSSPSSRHSVSTLKKWLTNPVRKLSTGGAAKVERQVHRLESKPKRKSLEEERKSTDLGGAGRQEENAAILPHSNMQPEWRDGPASCSISESENIHQQCYLSDLLQGEGTDSQIMDTQFSCPQEDLDGSTLLDDVSCQSSTTLDSEEERRSALEKSMYVLKELIETEKMYVGDLGLIVEGYIATMNMKGVPDDMKGKDKIVFGNIHQIYDWHKDYFLGELEKCMEEPERLAELFIKHERRLHMYVIYCQNKPKSEHIVSEYIETYFEELRQQLGHRLQLNDLLIKPVQRIMKYQLLLKDFLKYYTKAERDTTPLEKAVQVMCFVPKRCNDMMNVGRLQGFEGKITAQGKLLQQDTFTVTEQDCSFLSRAKERRVFLFEQLVIFSEPIDKKKGFSLPGLIFKSCIKVSCLGFEDCVDSDPCKFALTSRGADGNTVRYVLQGASPEIRQAWVCDVGQILETQRNFLNALQSPIEYQRRESKSNSLGRAMRAPLAASSTLRPHSSASIDRNKLPNLSSYNASLPSLYMPCHSSQDRRISHEKPSEGNRRSSTSSTRDQNHNSSDSPLHHRTASLAKLDEDEL
ncbi:rho guanine nucleotide exchange factor 25-like isoform X3 [Acipenser ruthenus]|uniref:rho guanine nucleotide exchange factor 25-like isoform X3 n=1 Tax=Acipenser ruthenus TaxID=7906 RepID=UPI00274080AA|nr:rho guanine nucleotide exchange factor 25-like isoform X3 [Acipenser ruthenus]